MIVALLLAAAAERSLSTGTFGEPGGSLMIAVNGEAGRFSGYYDGGRCRFALRGSLVPISVERFAVYPEGYEAEGWVPDHPERVFPVTLYSQVPNGYRQQITLEPGGSGTRPPGCPSRFTLDRAGSNADLLTDVRVVKPGPIRVYDFRIRGKRGIVVRALRRPPRPWSGVWISRTFSPAYRPAGYLYANWYVDGAPKAAYVRPRSLFPVPPEDQE
ncbi:hypothetical protein BSZ14_05185 [Sphingomonas sp. Sph1(2015)]|jgi:hypothetical protein|uniref:hypothetical protein n=1 Tax=Sphingomonas sp. Sph1(2015) TaxID=1628084 RepID=UPI000978D032|nr:hypothetical protein [Sphingomonas sp. Sph1(2015)]OMJ32999.1 hypothetical protein BSZ14_05185 [Sphingomonas sp. Sph1(2015)]